MIPNDAQHDAQMVPKWYPNDSQMIPKLCPTHGQMMPTGGGGVAGGGMSNPQQLKNNFKWF